MTYLIVLIFSFSAPMVHSASLLGTPSINSTSVNWLFRPPALRLRNGQVENYTLFYVRLNTSGVGVSVGSRSTEKSPVKRNASNQNDDVGINANNLEADNIYEFSLQMCTSSKCSNNRTLGNRTTLSAGKRCLLAHSASELLLLIKRKICGSFSQCSKGDCLLSPCVGQA